MDNKTLLLNILKNQAIIMNALAPMLSSLDIPEEYAELSEPIHQVLEDCLRTPDEIASILEQESL